MLDEIASIAVKEIIGMGAVGGLLILAIYALYKLFKRYDEVQEKRLIDAETSIKAIVGVTQALNDLTKALQNQLKT